MTGAVVGRVRELRAVAEMAAGPDSVLVVHGEAGIGKTALVEAALGAEARVVRGAESEREFRFAGLHQVLMSGAAGLEDVPEPGREALRRVLGMTVGPEPGPAEVAAAAEALLAGPDQVWFVDNADWLDEASLRVLAAIARKPPPRVVLVFAARGVPAELAGLPELALGPLPDEAAHALLTSTVPQLLDPQVRRRLVAEARGNPAALTGIRLGSRHPDLSGGFGPAGVRPLVDPREREFARQVRVLPWAARRLLLIAAAEPTGDPGVLRRAAAMLGIDAAEVTDLMTIGELVLFRHPVGRPATYHSAPLADRRQVHHVLAEALRGADPDQEAWHRGQAATAPSAEVADALENAAGSARARGGLGAAAAFLTRAAVLTPDPHRRADRLLTAAQAKLDSGDTGAATRLLVLAEALDLDRPQSARAALVTAKAELLTQPSPGSAPALVAAADRLAELDPALARETYLEALGAAALSGDVSDGDTRPVRAVALAAKDAPPAPHPPRPLDLLLDGLIVRFTEGYVAAAPLLRRALAAFRAAETCDVRWPWLCASLARELFDTGSIVFWSRHQVALLRASGTLALLPRALGYLAYVQAVRGLTAESAASLAEADAITAATGAAPRQFVEPFVAAFRGDEELAQKLLHEAAARAIRDGQGQALRVVRHSAAVLHNGLGQYRIALAAARSAAGDEDDLGTVGIALTELVEAAVRCEDLESAADALGRLLERTEASGTDFARGLADRSRALLTTGPAAERLYRSAITYLARGGETLWLARTHLIHGEWLRRAGRRIDARAELRVAGELFTHIGAAAFSARAHRELLATAESVKPAEEDGTLTTHEEFIAGLARDGLTNREIAARLVLSPRTVEWHLSKIFAKLGISSRRQLRTALPAE